jgi:hypothetical protein
MSNGFPEGSAMSASGRVMQTKAGQNATGGNSGRE